MNDDEIRKRLVEIRKTYQLSLPCDPYELASKISDAHISSQPLEDTKWGFTDFSANPIIVIINNNKDENKQAFALAHELGHYFLHITNPSNDYRNYFTNKSTYYMKRSREYDSIESDADTFACMLLLPEEEVRKKYNLELDLDDNLYKFSKNYHIPISKIQTWVECIMSNQL